MPRLALSLPTELGPGERSSSDPTVTGTDRRSVRAGADENEHDRPQIERWLDCWSR